MEKNLNYLFDSVPLYTKEEFKIFDKKDDGYYINREEYLKFLVYVGCKQDKIIIYCHRCKMRFPYTIERNIYLFGTDGKGGKESLDSIIFTDEAKVYSVGRVGYQEFGSFNLVTGEIRGNGEPYKIDLLYNNCVWYIEYSFTCTNDSNHKYIMFVSIEIKDEMVIVRKIGQNPSMLTVKGFDFDKYNKFLKKINAYDDYKKADLSFGEQFYAGAFTYLRRILEKMVNHYLEGKNSEDNRMETKINMIKENLDPRIRGLFNPLYGILSMGIHELDDDQCKKYYEYLKAIIDMQLQFIKTENEKNQQSKELNKVISEITNDLKNN